jgi:hypothetical protein
MDFHRIAVGPDESCRAMRQDYGSRSSIAGRTGSHTKSNRRLPLRNTAQLRDMKQLLFAICMGFLVSSAPAQSIHEYASVEFSPGIRKLGVFGTSLPAKVIDLKTVNTTKRDLDILVFFGEVQELERQGWELTSQDVVALDRGLHMYVWSLRKPR